MLQCGCQPCSDWNWSGATSKCNRCYQFKIVPNYITVIFPKAIYGSEILFVRGQIHTITEYTNDTEISPVLPPPTKVMFLVQLVCLFVCLCKNNFYETWWQGEAWTKEEPVKFRSRSESWGRSRKLVSFSLTL